MDENTAALNNYHNEMDKKPEPKDMRDVIAHALCRGVKFRAGSIELSFEDIQDNLIGFDRGIISIFKAGDLGIDFPQRKEEMDAIEAEAFDIAHRFEDMILDEFETGEEFLDYVHGELHNV